MSQHTQFNSKDLTTKPFLTQARKIGGRIVQEELVVSNLDGEDFVDTLLGNGETAITASEVDEGREKLMAENPQLASAGIHDLMDAAADSMDMGAELMEPKRAASTKRAGKLADEEGDTVNFKRMAGGTVEFSDDEGEIVEVMSNLEFDNLLDSNEYVVL